MAYRLPPLNWIRAFEASARHRSFTAAAKELNLTATAISHQVRSLERHLGYPLFERLARSVRLTGMGAAYLPDVRRALEHLAATTIKLFGMGSAATLTVRAPVSFVSLFLAQRLQAFQALHPRVHLQLFSLIWADALPDETTDIDIRFGTGHWPGYSAEPLLREPSVVVCHRDLLAGLADASPVERMRALAGGPLIHVVGYEDHWATAFRNLGLEPPPAEERSIRVDNSMAALSLAAGGAGSTIVLRSYARAAAAALPLELPFALTLPVEQANFLLTPHEGGPSKPEALVFKAWLQEQSRVWAAENGDPAPPAAPAGSPGVRLPEAR